ALKLRAANRPDVPDVQDADFGATPLLFRAPGCPPRLAVLHKSGALLVYDRDRIAAGPRQTLQIGDRTQLAAYGTYAYSARTRTLFVANNTSGDQLRGPLALPVGGACALQAPWRRPAPASAAFMAPPVAAGGV